MRKNARERGKDQCEINIVISYMTELIPLTTAASVVIIRSPFSPSPASVSAPTEMRYSVPGVSSVKVKLVWLGCRLATSELLE